MRATVPTEELRTRLADAAEVAVWNLASPAPWSAIDIVVPPYMGSNDLLTALSDVAVRLVGGQVATMPDAVEALVRQQVAAPETGNEIANRISPVG